MLKNMLRNHSKESKDVEMTFADEENTEAKKEYCF